MGDETATHPSTKRLFRAAKRYPPGDGEYRTDAEKDRPIPPDATEEFLRARQGLSAWDSSDKALEVALGSRSARCVVAYDIPENCGVAYEASLEPGHFTIRGDKEELKRCLSDVNLDVIRE